MTTSLMPLPKQHYTNNSGNPLAGGKVYTYSAGTTTPKLTYTDSAGTIPQANPIILNARGEPDSAIYWSGSYKVEVRDAFDNLIYTVDNYTSDPFGISAFVLSLASSIGSSLVGFIQAGAGAILRTVQDKLRERVSVADVGAVGDGVTISTAAILAAKNSLSAGGILRFGRGTFIIDTDACLTLNVAGLTIEGEGPATIIKAKDGAGLSNIVAITAAGCTVRNLVLDGNRNGVGTSNSASYGLFISASNARAENVEIRECMRIASFIGSGSAIPSNISYSKCWIHDNGGLDTTTGIGVGIYGGGSFLADNVVVDGCRFENNYNKFAGYPGDSTAMNIIATSVTVTNCFLKNNHNVGGGQLALTSDGSTGAPDGRFIVTNNTIVHDVTVAGENTTAIEIEGRKCVVSNNVVQSQNGDGVRFETSGGESVISNNTISCTGTGVNLITVAGTGVRETQINNNRVLSAGTGISVQPGAGVSSIYVIDNTIAPSVPTKIAGAGNCTLIRGNYGYNPAIQLGVVAGASPYTFPALNYDAFYSCSTVNGLFSSNVDGVNVSSSLLIPIHVKAGQQFTVFWAGSPPEYGICPQQ
jgi:hypothetical protein